MDALLDGIVPDVLNPVVLSRSLVLDLQRMEVLASRRCRSINRLPSAAIWRKRSASAVKLLGILHQVQFRSGCLRLHVADNPVGTIPDAKIGASGVGRLGTTVTWTLCPRVWATASGKSWSAG
ncbi:MAG: hypothetical protein NZ769_10020 [Anaerolineae bacterium]|nr:hypothetical protein [Anaerolineae bacterium]